MRALLSTLLLTTTAFAAEPAIVVRNAAVETLGAAGRMERATLIIRDGKIEAIGKDLTIPENARVIDAAGGTIMPGIVDPYFEITIAGASADPGPRTVNFGGRQFNVPGGLGGRSSAFTRIADNFYAHDAAYKPLRRVGLTRLNLVAAGQGQSAMIRANPDEPEQMMDQPDGVAFASISNSTDSVDQIRSRLETGKRGSASAASGKTSSVSAVNQLWINVFDGKTPLIVSAANSAAIVHLMTLTEPYKNLKLTIYAGGDALAEAVESLKGRNVRAIIRPTIEFVTNTRDRFVPARVLNDAGIEFSFSLSTRSAGGPAADDSLAAQDFPLFPVAWLVRSGLPRKAALEALCKRPAAILGLESSLGVVEKGKTADLLLFTGDPLDPNSRLRLVVIDGRTTYEN